MPTESLEPSSVRAPEGAAPPAPVQPPETRSDGIPARTAQNGMRLRSLARMARELGRSGTIDGMVEAAVREALGALGAASASVSRLEAGLGRVRTLINVGDLGPGEVERPDDETYRLCDFAQLGRVVGDLTPWVVRVDDPDADPAEVALLRDLDKGSSTAAPLIVDGTLWGELYATRHLGDRPFSENDLAYLETLAAILAGGISRATREETLGRLVYHDGLTGLANRRAVDETLARSDAVGPADAGWLSVVMIDVNGLKAVNDTFGHDAGDTVLTSVAGMLQAHFGDLHGSLLARVGGDEFAVLVPDQAVDRVVAVTRAMTESADALPFGAGLACGITSGRLDEPGVSAASVYRAADAAQYAAKRSGRRSCVSVAPVRDAS